MHCDNCSANDPAHGKLNPKWEPTQNLGETVWECTSCHEQKPRQVRRSKVTKLIDSGASLDAIIAQMAADREARAKR